MPGPVITLTCTNCGAPLTIHHDMEVFACGHCGTQLMVDRRGGTVGLKRVEAAIRQLQVGTDRTAAELAVGRLSKELEQLIHAEGVMMAEPVPVPPPIYPSEEGMTLMIFAVLLLIIVLVARRRVTITSGRASI